MTVAEIIEQHRPHLFGIAYRMLGSAADAEDALQEAFLRWHNAVASGMEIYSDRAWLTTTVTRICLDELRSARVRREEYVGQWLPEPLMAETEPDVAESAILDDTLSTAFMMLLERLTPKERAVFLLHDVFGYDYATIAGIVGETESYCRQIARRARTHVVEGRPRFEASPAKHQELVEQFVSATSTGNLPGLIEILAEDVTVWSDGGGYAQASRRPIVGRDKTIRALTGFDQHLPSGATFELAIANGKPAIYVYDKGQPIAVTTFGIVDGRISDIYIVVSPEKLARIGPPSSASG